MQSKTNQEQCEHADIDALPAKLNGYLEPMILPRQNARERLEFDFVQQVLNRQGEDASEEHVGHYSTIRDLAAMVRQSKCWTQGEVFCCLIDEGRYIIMKQVAPSSCEMLTLTQNGFHDVLTAYRFSEDELVALLQSYVGIAVDRNPGNRDSMEQGQGTRPQLDLSLSGQERDALLAALKLLEVSMKEGLVQPNDGDIGDLLTNGGEHEGLTPWQISALADRVVAEYPAPVLAKADVTLSSGN